MKTILVPLNGHPAETLYQLGQRERDAFLRIESRVTNLLSANFLLRQGHDLISRAKFILKKKQDSFFDKCIAAYAEGLGIDHARYLSFLSLLELAAHYGQTYPDLKSVLPGCSSVFAKVDGDITHTRLLDFPLTGIFEENPRLYLWQQEGKESLLTMSCEGLAPLFFQGIHGSGISFALHHKPGKTYHKEGQSIFQIAFETFFEINSFGDFKKEIKKKNTMTKWCFLLAEKSGQVLIIDIDGPGQNSESYHLNDSSPLVFTNIPLHQDAGGFEHFLRFSRERQEWLKDKMSSSKSVHILDAITDVQDQRKKNWIHPGSTLSTVGAYHTNLSKGHLDLKEGECALTSSDAVIRVDLTSHGEMKVLKQKGNPSPFEKAWKRASMAQSYFDQGKFDHAYHELQMAKELTPHPLWKDIFSFYLYFWDFKFISNSRELTLIYKKVKALSVPPQLEDQKVLLIMRLEKKLDLSPTVNYQDVSPPLQNLFQQEKLASKPLFATWMNLLYPRLELLDIFSPHQK